VIRRRKSARTVVNLRDVWHHEPSLIAAAVGKLHQAGMPYPLLCQVDVDTDEHNPIGGVVELYASWVETPSPPAIAARVVEHTEWLLGMALHPWQRAMLRELVLDADLGQGWTPGPAEPGRIPRLNAA
jgi:hypothetical protein